MSAAVEPRTEIRLMQPSDLKAVAAVERAAYAFPWSLGIFRDCLLAGYYCLVLDVGKNVDRLRHHVDRGRGGSSC